MKLHILAVGDRVPSWAQAACADYQKRFPSHCSLRIQAVPTPRRGKNADVSKLKYKEYQLLSGCIPKGALVVALDEAGKSCTTKQLAGKLDRWMHRESDVAFLIGGPDGLHPDALQNSKEHWSLSTLTLPHALVRVVVVEQLYRGLSILGDHPYHRG